MSLWLIVWEITTESAGNKPLYDKMLAFSFNTLWHHQTTMSLENITLATFHNLLELNENVQGN